MSQDKILESLDAKRREAVQEKWDRRRKKRESAQFLECNESDIFEILEAYQSQLLNLRSEMRRLVARVTYLERFVGCENVAE